MKIKNIQFAFCLIVMLMLCGCGCGITREEQEKLDIVATQAVEYIEEKYGKTFEVESSHYFVSWGTEYPTHLVDDDIKIELTDGTVILYKEEEKQFYDNYQADIIIAEFRKKIWEPLLKSIEPYWFDSISDITLNLYQKEDFYGNFFHEYYDGDINTYVQKEKMSIDFGYYSENNTWNPLSLYIISEDENFWKDRFNIIAEKTKAYKNSVNFIAVTSATLQDNFFTSIHIGMEGCFATGSVTSPIVQKYIKILDGVYVTSAQHPALEEKDFVLKEIMSGQELQSIIDNVANEKETSEVYSVNSITPVYKLEVSEEFHKKYEYSNMSVYIKFIPEELGISTVYNLYQYKNDSNHYRSDILVEGNEKNGKYVYLSLDEDNYYWIGTQTEENH